MEKLAPYRDVKASGTEWLGDVPAHWQVRSLGSLITPRSERGRPDLPLLSVVREKGVVPRSELSREENHNFIPDDLGNYKIVRKGDLVVNKMKAWQGSLGVAPCDGIVSPAYYVFSLNLEDKLFGQRLLRSPAYVAAFARVSDGVRPGQWDLSLDGMKRIPLAVPPQSEQAAIVRLLDHFDAQMARYARTKRALLQLFDEKKQVIAHSAVTRGVQAGVELRPAGVDWLGDIPAHWEVKRLKALLTEVDQRSTTGAETLLSLRMHRGLVPHNDVSEIPITEAALIGYKRCRRGQLVMNRMRAAIGMFAIAPQDGLVSPDYAVFDVSPDVNKDYLLTTLKLPSMGQVFRANSKGLGTGSSGFMRLYTDRLGTIYVPFPPLDEQLVIFEAISDQIFEIDSAIDVTRRELSLLVEYRMRSIHDVVLGRIDTRCAAEALEQAWTARAQEASLVEHDLNVSDEEREEYEEEVA